MQKTKVYVDGLRYESIITELTIPASIEHIPSDLFKCAYNIKKVKFTRGADFFIDRNMLFNSDKTILYYCFDKKFESVTIPSTVTEIGAGAFRNCTNLKSVTIPSTVKTVGGYAFYNCTELSNVTLEKGIVEIADYAFVRCDNITEIIIPKSVKSIALNFISFTETTPGEFGPKIKLYKDSFADIFIRENASSFSLYPYITKCIVYID